MRLPDVEKRETWVGRLFLWSEILLITGFLIFYLYVEIATPSPIMSQAVVPQPQPNSVEWVLRLKRGDFILYRYMPGQPEFAAHPKALIIFGSGDGGLSGWEDRVCKALQADGYEVISLDYYGYSRTDYDLDILQADMNTIAQNCFSRFGNHPPPLILGGWSMGAEQAVPAAGGPHPPTGLVGLLLISPGSRGRYGVREADRWNVPPTGNGTFAMEDFAHRLNGLRVVQWDGNLDLLGSKTWLSSLTATHKVFGFPALHDYNGASDDFLTRLKQSVTWILSPPSTEAGQ